MGRQMAEGLIECSIVVGMGPGRRGNAPCVVRSTAGRSAAILRARCAHSHQTERDHQAECDFRVFAGRANGPHVFIRTYISILIYCNFVLRAQASVWGYEYCVLLPAHFGIVREQIYHRPNRLHVASCHVFSVFYLRASIHHF